VDRLQKEELVKGLQEKLSTAKVVITTDYKGLDVAAVSDLRRKLKEAGVEYQVVKNTLLRRVAEDNQMALMADSFIGPSAIAYSFDDPVAPAKVLTEFAKENDNLEIKAGVMEGQLMDLAAIKALSSLPSKEALLGQLLSVMNGVPTSFVRVLNAVPQGFVNILGAMKDQQAEV
jgi:large subunit ribosomal protein L10